MQKIIIQKNQSGERIDKFLKREIFLDAEFTRGEIIRQIKSGNVLVNKKKIKPSYVLKKNDTLEINISSEKSGLAPNDKIKFEMLYEDKNFIVINKPAGLSVHPTKKSEKDTLVNGLIYKFPEIKNVGDTPEERPGIVHRLDRDTSGVMLVAKNQKTFLELKNKFKNREVQKIYLAIVHGKISGSGIIDKSLARSKSYKKQIIAHEKTKTKVRLALTEYKVLKNFEDYSLVEALPKTGRTHQIRIHLFSVGHPIIGDKTYKLKNKKASANTNRQMLHAQKIEFELLGKKYAFSVKPPEDFLKFLASLDESQIKS